MESRKAPKKPTIFNKNLKVLRESKGLSQREVAKAVGFKDNKMVAWYENTGSIPPFEKIVKFAEFYQVSYDFLFENQVPVRRVNPTELKVTFGLEVNSLEYLIMYKSNKKKENIKRLKTINELICNPTLLDSISTIIDNLRQ